MSSSVGIKLGLTTERELTLEPELQDPNNLNRIRNNQRRSRARRKEYLQELEGKLRKCESMGVEASMEIQASARLVAEENKRLRALLQSRGIMSQEIDTAVGAGGAGTSAPSKAEILEAKLNAKKTCSGHGAKTGCSRPQPDMPSQLQTSTGTRDSTCKRPVPLMPLMPLLTTITNPLPLPASPLLESRLSSTSPTSSALTTPGFSPTEQPSQFGGSCQEASADLSAEISPGNDNSSCTFAANIITSMRADVSAEEVKAELGCGNNVECKVDNSTFFTTMDRYTE